MPYVGFKGLINLLGMLNEKKIFYNIDYQRDGAILIRATLVGVRLEMEVFEDHFEFSSFVGDESIDSDVKKFEKLIEENWN